MSDDETTFDGEGKAEVVVTPSGETQDHVSQEMIQAEHEQETLPEDPDPEAPIDSTPPPDPGPGPIEEPAPPVEEPPAEPPAE